MSKVEKFKKKPVEIEAIQWTGDNLKEIIDFTGLHKSAQHLGFAAYNRIVKQEGFKLFVDGGSLMVELGSWIIKGTAGEIYPCKQEIFEEIYERVGENNKND